MAYDPELAARVWKLMAPLDGVRERKMFGGVAFMLHGHMCCGVVGDRVVLRLGNEAAARALEEPGIEAMDFTGRPLRSMVYLEPARNQRDADLNRWVRLAIGFTKTLPPKQASHPSPARSRTAARA
jgi:TfoX/Sxy family transcriptional regulator of competence genes